ncbi:MAG: hypothetical protein ACKVYV_16360 [Limisphaerales bacterium]
MIAAAQALPPRVEDHGWFSGTDLLVSAHHPGLRLGELPVRWVDTRTRG